MSLASLAAASGSLHQPISRSHHQGNGGRRAPPQGWGAGGGESAHFQALPPVPAGGWSPAGPGPLSGSRGPHPFLPDIQLASSPPAGPGVCCVQGEKPFLPASWWECAGGAAPSPGRARGPCPPALPGCTPSSPARTHSGPGMAPPRPLCPRQQGRVGWRGGEGRGGRSEGARQPVVGWGGPGRDWRG